MDVPTPPTTECWLWKGSIRGHGYGRLRLKGRYVAAHRFAYELTKGPIPKGLTIDHLCRVRNCIRPSHLEITTMRVNALRGVGASAVNARKTACASGHKFNVITSQGRRRCKACTRETRDKWHAVNPEKVSIYCKRYRAANPERCKARDNKYRTLHLEEVAARARRYRKAMKNKEGG